MSDNNPQTFWLENLKAADRYNNWIFEQIEPHLGNNVLEVGCGNGNFTLFLAQECDRILGIDIDAEFSTLAQTRLQAYPQVKILTADITTLKLAEKFDTIILLDVLEHIEDDVAMLRKLTSRLKPGGKLIIKVPALNSIYGEMDRVIGHYRRYNQQSLIQTFSQAKIHQPQTWYFNWAGIPGWWLNSKVLKRTTPPAQQVSLFNKVVPLFRTLEKLVKFPVGLSLFAVAQKNQKK